MWDDIEKFIAQRPKVSLQELFNAIDSLGADLRTLEEFSIALHSYAMGYEFDANYKLPPKGGEKQWFFAKTSEKITTKHSEVILTYNAKSSHSTGVDAVLLQ